MEAPISQIEGELLAIDDQVEEEVELTPDWGLLDLMLLHTVLDESRYVTFVIVKFSFFMIVPFMGRLIRLRLTHVMNLVDGGICHSSARIISNLFLDRKSDRLLICNLHTVRLNFVYAGYA